MEFTDNYSAGCVACQNGRWLCVFLTYLCNASCSFCPAPYRNKDFVQSAFGNNPSVILKYMDRITFQGISFSGGECFLVYNRMIDWLEFFKKHKPELYFWAYTNGINVKMEQMEGLRKSGLNELRFNIAATHYNDKSVLKTISCATEIFEHVAVEIPSIPEEFELLKETIDKLEESGVDYLNLHEYILVPDDPVTKNAPKGEFLMNFELELEYHQQSLANTERIRILCSNNGYNIKVNNCSLHKKEHQMAGRRRTMGTLFKENHEKQIDDGFLETIYVPGEKVVDLEKILSQYHKIDRLHLTHPDQYEKGETDAYLLKISPKLSTSENPRVLKFIKI